jgi:hypothetical protein
MKKIFILLCFMGILTNCSKNEDFGTIITESATEVMVNPMSNEAFAMGNFVAGAHPTSGKASVNSDKTVLTFKDFKTDNGPKLLVYLSTNSSAAEFINLGDLKGIEDDFTYSIPANTDLIKYKIVNIWCVDFSVSFGHAELKK